MSAEGLELDEAERLRAAMEDVRSASRDAAGVLSRGLRQALVDGRSLEQVLRSAALSLSNRALSAALAPLEQGISSGISGLAGQLFSGLASGFSGGGILPFAKGGVVAAPGYFPLPGGGAGALGLMGEAGAEAVLPLSRDASGRLGVAAGAAGGGQAMPQIVFNVEARDAESFARSEAQIATMVARAVGRGRRGL
ncbi:MULTISPECIES: phage tail tape measure protein [Stappia]|uniref:Phage tail tape measure protein n=1 Tax=Stappia indica TaxID=538381 RepID=A0A857CD81_9HYPH|nr:MULTISPECIES: phage tail tape measure protein [Stappia]MBC2858852.1 phage tail tape measure protein [Stappia sp. 28M-7]QGZ36805.1 phage tail tape measure protein [Stappia indica]